MANVMEGADAGESHRSRAVSVSTAVGNRSRSASIATAGKDFGGSIGWRLSNGICILILFKFLLFFFTGVGEYQ